MVVRLDNPVVEETRKATFGWLFCWGNIPSIFEGWINIVNGEEAMKLDVEVFAMLELFAINIPTGENV